MKTFWLFFGLCLEQRLFSFTENLPKTLQKESMSAVRGHRLTMLTKETDGSYEVRRKFQAVLRIIYGESLAAIECSISNLSEQKNEAQLFDISLRRRL